jgi:hypothetical protein
VAGAAVGHRERGAGRDSGATSRGGGSEAADGRSDGDWTWDVGRWTLDAGCWVLEAIKEEWSGPEAVKDASGSKHWVRKRR